MIRYEKITELLDKVDYVIFEDFENRHFEDLSYIPKSNTLVISVFTQLDKRSALDKLNKLNNNFHIVNYILHTKNKTKNLCDDKIIEIIEEYKDILNTKKCLIATKDIKLKERFYQLNLNKMYTILDNYVYKYNKDKLDLAGTLNHFILNTNNDVNFSREIVNEVIDLSTKNISYITSEMFSLIRVTLEDNKLKYYLQVDDSTTINLEKSTINDEIVFILK